MHINKHHLYLTTPMSIIFFYPFHSPQFVSQACHPPSPILNSYLRVCMRKTGKVSEQFDYHSKFFFLMRNFSLLYFVYISNHSRCPKHHGAGMPRNWRDLLTNFRNHLLAWGYPTTSGPYTVVAPRILWPETGVASRSTSS